MAETTRRPRVTRSRVSRSRSLGRLRTYSVTGLFNASDYHFELDPKEPTLLTGVNGTGKSTVLRSIDAISTGNWATLLEIPFTSLVLGFGSNRELSVRKSAKGSVTIELTGEEAWRLGEYDREAEREFDHLRMLERELALHERGTSAYSASEREELLERMYMLRNRREAIRARRRDYRRPDWAVDLSEIFPVLFITDQRLIIERPKTDRTTGRVSTRTAADEASRQIAGEINLAKTNYANSSQALDRTFPQRVIRAIAHPPRISEEKMGERLEALTRQRKALESVGLVPAESEAEFEGLDLSPMTVRAVINTYIEDTRRKLEALEPLRNKLQLFSDFLNQHYGRKRINIDPEHGFTIAVNEEANSSLPPSKLSSGEQQMMVLAHHILFKARPGTLVLIDEPELSLHVLWQASFVEDLAQMGQVNGLSFLLATHSPTLIGGREDLKRSLDRLSGA